MFNFDKIESSPIIAEPYTHLICESFADSDVLQDSHVILEECEEWNTEDTHDMKLYNLPVIHPLLDDIINKIEDYNWQPLLEKLGVEYSKYIFSWQATKISSPLGPHTDEPELTGVVAKILIYMTPDIDCGTIVHNSLYDIVKVTPGKIGDAFLFKTSANSFHSTNYDDIDINTKRVVLVGTFHV